MPIEPGQVYRSAYHPGDRILTATGDQDPADGTAGTVVTVADGYGNGINITLDDGRQFNILECGLEPEVTS